MILKSPFSGAATLKHEKGRTCATLFSHISGLLPRFLSKNGILYTFLVFTIVLFLAYPAHSAFRRSVKVPLANIRSGPGTEHPILWKVEKYHPLIVISQSGSWYHIRDFESDTGWVYAPLLNSTESVIVNKDNVNVRAEPGTDNPIVFKVEKGVPFKVIEEKGNWIHIRHLDGDEGWIHKMLVW